MDAGAWDDRFGCYYHYYPYVPCVVAEPVSAMAHGPGVVDWEIFGCGDDGDTATTATTTPASTPASSPAKKKKKKATQTRRRAERVRAPQRVVPPLPLTRTDGRTPEWECGAHVAVHFDSG